jgi:hypothetical protein
MSNEKEKRITVVIGDDCNSLKSINSVGTVESVRLLATSLQAVSERYRGNESGKKQHRIFSTELSTGRMRYSPDGILLYISVENQCLNVK